MKHYRKYLEESYTKGSIQAYFKETQAHYYIESFLKPVKLGNKIMLNKRC